MERPPALDREMAALAALGDPVRRSLYDHVARSPAAVSRNAAALALELPRSTVAFHLDRLVVAGLLAVERRRVGDRSGPGAGRPSKLYRRAAAEVAVSLPPRRYDLIGDLLATALDGAVAGESGVAALTRVARERGRESGRASASLEELLARNGYEPISDAGGTGLGNCPFHALAADHRELVCAANRAYLAGAAETTGVDAERVRLTSDGHCCVRID